jgi:hypothetical protein
MSPWDEEAVYRPIGTYLYGRKMYETLGDACHDGLRANLAGWRSAEMSP